MSVTIAKLSINDHVHNPEGARGVVKGFDRDHVLILWEHGETWRYTDEELQAYGVRLVEGARVCEHGVFAHSCMSEDHR